MKQKPGLFALLVLVLLGLALLSWRLLEHQPTLIQFLALIVEAAAVLLVLLGIQDLAFGRLFWQELQRTGWWQVGLGVLAVALWGAYFFLSFHDAKSPSSNAEHTTYTVKNVCASGSDHPSEKALKQFLLDEAEQQAGRYFGPRQQGIAQVASPEFYPGVNLGEVCIRTTFTVARENSGSR